MSLDWSQVKKKYGKGTKIPTVAGGKTLEITGADDQAIYIKSPLWTAKLSRNNLEKAVDLIEQGVITREPGLFVEDYRVYVADERPTSAAHVLRDLGFLEKDQGYHPRC